jgi:hypothetical protein
VAAARGSDFLSESREQGGDTGILKLLENAEARQGLIEQLVRDEFFIEGAKLERLVTGEPTPGGWNLAGTICCVRFCSQVIGFPARPSVVLPS